MIFGRLYWCFFYLVFVVNWFARTVKNYLRAVWLAFKLPGPRALPLLGNVLIIRNTNALVDIANNISQRYAPLCRTWMFFVPIIIVYEPDHIKSILSNTTMSDKNFFYSIMHTFIGDGLITSTGHKWKRQRKMIQPLFQNNFLKRYLEVFTEISESMIKELSNGPETINITKAVNAAILNILHKTVLGVNITSEDETPFRRGELFILKRVLRPWLLFDSVFKRSEMSEKECKQFNDLSSYVTQVIEKRIVEERTNVIKNTCLLDQLLELVENQKLRQEDVLNEAVTFMLAGQDSVGATVAFALFQLAKHPDIQEKVHQEIEEICYGDVATMSQLEQMVYLEQCIKETLRLLPSIPLIARVLTTDVKLGQHTIPCGTNIFISPFATHRLPEYFPEPEKFNPDRFGPENIKKMHSFSFLPFSLGPRNCIGYKFAYLQMKSLIASIVRNFKIGIKNGREDLSLSYRVTLRAKGGIWLSLSPRKKRYVD